MGLLDLGEESLVYGMGVLQDARRHFCGDVSFLFDEFLEVYWQRLVGRKDEKQVPDIVRALMREVAFGRMIQGTILLVVRRLDVTLFEGSEKSLW